MRWAIGLRLNATGSLGSLAAMTVQRVGGCESRAEQEASNVFSFTLERKVPPGKWRRLHHRFNWQKELARTSWFNPMHSIFYYIVSVVDYQTSYQT